MTQPHGEQSKRFEQIVAEAWADPAFKRRLLADPAVVLRERGIELPAGVQVQVVEDTEQITHLILPAMPEEAALSNELLAQVAGGAGNGGGTGKWPKAA